ncbi:MAG: ABC transporter substrate-binding protein [Candidatus Faecousia sp.]|nr:ABC transporter substrate-binding protein [Bacillota bacterium]MDY4218821.1 ABC transporter substrate-binding protein [Candidatus Faecousia sp.]
MKKVWMFLLTMALVLSMCACGANESPSTTPAGTTAPADDYGTVVIDNNGREITFTQMPQRVISMNIQTTEMMLALGLEDKLIGTSYNNCEVLPEYKEAFDQIPILSETYASHEVIISQEPDFLIGRNTAFREKASGTVEQFDAAGIPVYQAKGTIVSGRPEVMDDVYEDIRNLGKIFKVEEKADALIAEMKGEIDQVQEALSSVEEPLKVLVIDSLDGNEIFTASNALESELIRLAGGQNIAPDMGKNWATISMEVATDANPDIIVFNVYEDTTLEEKIAAAEAVDALRDTGAVKNKRYVGIPLTSVHESIRTADTVRYLAENFYPELFQ